MQSYAEHTATALDKYDIPGWAAEPGSRGDGTDAYLTHPDGRRLHIWNDSGRLRVSATYPDRGYPGFDLADGTGYERIALAATRPPDQAAREITRRLLPGYSLTLARVQAWLDDRSGHMVADAAVIRRLASLVPRSQTGTSFANDRKHSLTSDCGWKIRAVAYRGKVELHLHELTPETAAAILEMIVAGGDDGA